MTSQVKAAFHNVESWTHIKRSLYHEADEPLC